VCACAQPGDAGDDRRKSGHNPVTWKIPLDLGKREEQHGLRRAERRFRRGEQPGVKASDCDLGGKVEPHEAVKESTSRSGRRAAMRSGLGRVRAAQQCAERTRNATTPPGAIRRAASSDEGNGSDTGGLSGGSSICRSPGLRRLRSLEPGLRPFSVSWRCSRSGHVRSCTMTPARMKATPSSSPGVGR
jgi:hypothetical protein